MKKTMIIAGALALCAAPALANEEHLQKKVDFYFGKIDTNRDGSISKGEHDAFSAGKFTRVDSNRDNAISKEELLAEKKQEKEEFNMKYGDKDDID